jgi:hypothetical protein
VQVRTGNVIVIRTILSPQQPETVVDPLIPEVMRRRLDSFMTRQARPTPTPRHPMLASLGIAFLVALVVVLASMRTMF